MENLQAAVALHFAFYNFVRVHKNLWITPAMAAGVDNRLWSLHDLVEQRNYEIPVKVHGRDYKLSVHQEKKTVWVATGIYMGESYQAKGRTERDAASRWQEWARYKGDDPAPSN